MHLTLPENVEDFIYCGMVAGIHMRVSSVCVILTHGLDGSCSCSVPQLQGVDEHLSPPLSTGQCQLQQQ